MDARVEIANGTVEGVNDGGVLAWRGIRYAAAADGEFRYVAT